MRIATYNVNGINGRLAVLLRWLELAEPDVVCLQELKAPDASFPEAAIRDLGYDAIWHGQKSWNGVAILSRVGEIHETRRGLPGDADDDDGNFFYLAGVWEPAMAGWPLAFRIINVPANAEVSKYQDRHGAIILRRQVMDWLDAIVPEDELLTTPPAHMFIVEEVGRGRLDMRQAGLAL